ncbi:MAG: DNA primase [Chloroflexi bacterium]|nr:DNA primase [Chloroflexota bacterium]
MTVVEEIKDRVDIAELIGESMQLKKSGKNFTGFCPFHANTRTPAFVVFPDTGTWRCFGACNEGGDVYKYVMKKEGWDFPQALQNLAERAGVELRPRTPEQEEQEEAQVGLRGLLESAVTFYRNNLLHSDQVLGYLQGRGFSSEALESFGVGYAPDSWDALQAFLLEKGHKHLQLVEAGLIAKRENGGFYDRFRNRIMFPIRDARGRMAGFGARISDPKDQPKFINSPQTVLFDKGRLLFGLDGARKAIRAADQAVVVEGYFDVIALHQAGHGNAVSPMGTALTSHQLRSLKRYSRNIVLALDADAAGNQATLRGLNVAREALDREPDPVFDARGLVRHEGRLDAEIRIVGLPEGKDPDEVALEDPEAWTDLLRKASPVVEYVMDLLIGPSDSQDAKQKAAIARQVLPLIEDVADPVEREAYRQGLARRLKVDERAMMGWRPKRTTRTQASAPDLQQVDSMATEGFCLGLLLRDPELTYWIDRQLHALELEGLSSQDFIGTDSQVIFKAVQSSLGQVDEEPTERWKALLDGTALDQAIAFASKAEEVDFARPKVADAVSADFFRLRMRRVEGLLEQLSFQQQAVQELETVEQEMISLAKKAQNLVTQKRRLDVALAGRK